MSEDAVDIKELDSVAPIDEAKFRWIMNEDPMATEKLAEGIRVFARDQRTLRETILARLE